MASELLKDVTVRNLKPQPGRQIFVRDNRIKGFGVCVSPGGTKTFQVVYLIGKKAKRLTIGRYPSMTLSDARQRASAALNQVADGRDPAVEKQRARAEYHSKLFETLVDDFIQNYAKKRTRNWAETERLLKREFIPLWKKWPIHTISRRDVTKALNSLVDRGAPSVANHGLAAICKMLNWAIEQDLIDRSPCFGVKAPARIVSRDRVLSEGDLIKVWLAAERMGYPYGAIVRLLILTAQRPGEVSGMRWSELDLVKAQWLIPKERTKPGREHLVPLSPLAITLIKGLPRLHDDLVFPARGKDNPLSGFSKWKRELDGLSEVAEWQIRDIRRTVTTALAELKVPPHVAEAILNSSKRNHLGCRQGLQSPRIFGRETGRLESLGAYSECTHHKGHCKAAS